VVEGQRGALLSMLSKQQQRRHLGRARHASRGGIAVVVPAAAFLFFAMGHALMSFSGQNFVKRSRGRTRGGKGAVERWRQGKRGICLNGVRQMNWRIESTNVCRQTSIDKRLSIQFNRQSLSVIVLLETCSSPDGGVAASEHGGPDSKICGSWPHSKIWQPGMGPRRFLSNQSRCQTVPPYR
jgi:hypothetical protein